MKKLLAMVLALIMVAAAIPALADFTVAFSQIGQESDWRTANTDSINAWVGGHEGWTYVYDDAQQKQENQIKALGNYINQGVDVIVLTCIVDSGWENILKQINEEEIPLILVDRMPDCMDDIEYYAAFGGDFVEEGRRQVAWAGEYLKTLGRGEEEVTVAIMEGTTGSGAQVGRTEGNLAAMEAYPNMKLVAQQSGNFTRAEGQALMESWLKSIDKIDVLIAQNDDMALGAIEAIKNAGLVPGKDIIIVGCDSVKAAFQAIVDGEMNATIECTPLYGPAVVAAIEKLQAGEPASRELQHPEEGVFDMDGGIDVGGVVSIKAADVINDRVY